MLNIPQAFLNGFSGNTSSVYPIVIITAGNNIIRLSQIKGFFDGDYYEDRNLRVNSIREKIDVQDKKFQTNQVCIEVSNYIINQIRFSEKFKGFSFTNATVDIYYANEACQSLDDCLFIYKGFVKSYEGDKNTVSFDVEDHSQYTLEEKTLPKYKTVDPDAEEVEDSKDIHFPFVYGHVDKSPMIFSKGSNGSIFSNIYPDAIMYDDIKIKGIASTEAPISIFKSNMYLPVPENFKDVPEDFFVNGYDYSRYNETSQYTLPEEGNRSYIQIEKKSSDFENSALLPLSIASRDQFQVDTRREVTGINADTSAGLGSDDSGDYLEYGDGSGIRYLGKNDGYEPYGENNHWSFPRPTGQIKQGYYQDFVLSGIVRKMRKSYYSGSQGQDILFGNSSHACLVYHTHVSTGTVNGVKGFDMIYLPMPEGEGQTELIQYFNEDYIADNDIVEINWKTENATLWDGHTWAELSNDPSDNLPNYPESSSWFETNDNYYTLSRDNWTQYLWGVELKNSNGDVVDVIGIDNELTGENGDNLNLRDIIKPEVYAWITQIDEQTQWSETWQGLTPDSVVNLRKLLWGRRITEQESGSAVSPEFEIAYGFKKSYPLGCCIYGLYPCLAYNTPKHANNNHTYTQPSNPPLNGGYQWQYIHYELIMDSLFSFKNPYLANQEDPIGDDNWQSILTRLEEFNYGLLNTPREQNRLVITRHNWVRSYARSEDYASRIAFYGNQPLEWELESTSGAFGYEIADHAYQASKMQSAGIKAVNGGNWVAINNNQGTKDMVKLDLTFQSLGGDDIVLGGVYTRIRGKVTVDAFKNPSNEIFGGGRPALRVECDALWKFDDEIIKVDDNHFTNGVFGMPDAVIDQDGNPEEFFTFVTGILEDDDGNLIGYTNPHDVPPITFDEDNPLYINTECDAFKYIINDDGDKEEADIDQWKQNVNSVNNISITYHIEKQHLTQDSDITSNTTLFFKTRIDNFTLDQRFIVSNASNQKYFGEVYGRVDDSDGRYTGIEDIEEQQLIKKPSDILMHIMEKELGYSNEDGFDQESIQKARNNHIGWNFDFAVSEEMGAKEFIEDFAKSTKLIPRFRHDGTFSFINMFQNYNQSDAVIQASDVTNFVYSKTDTEDIKLMVRVKYMYDYGTKKYTEATNLSNDGAVPKNVENMQEMYSINSLTDAYLEVESKYIRDSNTATLLRNYLLEWHKNQHNIIECTLPPKYMYLECGDIVEFDSLIEGMTIFGEDYTQSYFIGGGDGSDYSQEALPFFIVQDIKKSQKNVRVELLQLHKSNVYNIEDNSPNYLTGDFYVPVDETPEEDIVAEQTETIILGDVNLDGEVNIMDIVSIADIVIGDMALADISPSVVAASDVDQDGYITILDLLRITQAIINNEDLGEIEV